VRVYSGSCTTAYSTIPPPIPLLLQNVPKPKKRSRRKKLDWSNKKADRNTAGQLLIYLVTCREVTSRGRGRRTRFHYYGRTKGGRGSDEELDKKWMDENGMGVDFRDELIKQFNNRKERQIHEEKGWVRVPESSAAKQGTNTSPPRRTLSWDVSGAPSPRFYNQSVYGYCVHASICSALSYMGALDQERYMREQLQVGLSSCVQQLHNMKGFVHNRLPQRSLFGFDPVKCEKESLYVLQISSTNVNTFNDHLTWDNTHVLCVYGGLIFDANMQGPLELTENNIDLCCVGGDEFIFHHVSRAHRFQKVKRQPREYRFTEPSGRGHTTVFLVTQDNHR